MKICRCGTRFSSLTRDECLACSGWCCLAPNCGRSKTPEQSTCGRAVCKRWYTRTEPQRADERRKVVSMAARGKRQ